MLTFKDYTQIVKLEIHKTHHNNGPNIGISGSYFNWTAS